MRLSHLISRAERGEDIVLARDGVPAARIVPIRKPIAKVIELIKQERPEGPFASADNIRSTKEDGRA